MQRSSRGKLLVAFNCGPVTCNFCQFCVNMCFGMAWKPRSGSVWSKRWSWNWKRLWFEAGFVPTWRRWTSSAACWQEHRAAFMDETENANPWHMWGKQDGKHPSDRASRANHELWNRDWSILCHSCHGQMKYCKVQHQQLTLGQFVLLPMQGWNWPVFEMFPISGACLSHHTITAMHVCDSRFDNHWHGAKSFAQLILMSAAAQRGARLRSVIPVMLAELGPDLWREGSVQHGLVNSKIHDLAGRVEKMRHCCMKLDVQKGRGSDRSPTIVKAMRWWVLAANLEAFVLTWRYPCGTSDIPAMLIAGQG